MINANPAKVRFVSRSRCRPCLVGKSKSKKAATGFTRSTSAWIDESGASLCISNTSSKALRVPASCTETVMSSQRAGYFTRGADKECVPTSESQSERGCSEAHHSCEPQGRCEIDYVSPRFSTCTSFELVRPI